MDLSTNFKVEKEEIIRSAANIVDDLTEYKENKADPGDNPLSYLMFGELFEAQLEQYLSDLEFTTFTPHYSKESSVIEGER